MCAGFSGIWGHYKRDRERCVSSKKAGQAPAERLGKASRKKASDRCYLPGLTQELLQVAMVDEGACFTD